MKTRKPRPPKHCGQPMTFNGLIYECVTCRRWFWPEPAKKENTNAHT